MYIKVKPDIIMYRGRIRYMFVFYIRAGKLFLKRHSNKYFRLCETKDEIQYAGTYITI